MVVERLEKWALRGRSVSYRIKLMFSVIALLVITGLAITAVSYRNARTRTEAMTLSLFESATLGAAQQTRDYADRAVPTARAAAGLAGAGLALGDQNLLARQLLAFLRANPGVSWVSLGDENGSFTGAYRTAKGQLRINQSHRVDGRSALVEYDVQPDGSWQEFRRENDSGYDPRTRPYYEAAKRAGKLTWLPPYVFYEQAIPGITCANPIFDKDGKLAGVVTVDFDLNSLSSFARNVAISPHSEAMIFTPEGVLLGHPKVRVVSQSGKRDEGRLLTMAESGDPLAEQLYAQVQSQGKLTVEDERTRRLVFTHGGVSYLGCVTAVRIEDGPLWLVGALGPRSDFLGDVQRENLQLLLISLAAVLLAAGLAVLLAKRVSQPIVRLVEFAHRVGAGDLEQKVELDTTTEFRTLSASLTKMLADLRDHLRLRESLAVAMEVQRRLLPSAAPKVRGMDIAGYSAYCDETGGDYYDYIELDPLGPGQLLVVLGDVMGHGIASALTMAGARGVIRSQVQSGVGPAPLLTHLNGIIYHDTRGTRFMTICLAIIDTARMQMRWASAGHDPPVVYDRQADTFISLEGGDVPLGVVDEVAYEEYLHAPLKPGHVILVGTDGIWETANASGELFGKSRLEDVLRANAGKSADDIQRAVVAAVDAHRGAEKQKDDVTFVIIKVC